MELGPQFKVSSFYQTQTGHGDFLNYVWGIDVHMKKSSSQKPYFFFVFSYYWYFFSQISGITTSRVSLLHPVRAD